MSGLASVVPVLMHISLHHPIEIRRMLTPTSLKNKRECVQLPAIDEAAGLAAPEFGFTTGNPSSCPQARGGSALSWAAMRQVGAGFWLTDQQVRRVRTQSATLLKLLINP